MAGVGAGALLALALAVAPALGAPEQLRARAEPGFSLADVDAFTPASADPKLAALFARSGLATSSFRFTPTTSRHANRAVTVAVRARSTRAAVAAERGAVATEANIGTIGIAPIAYNLGAAVGWRRFALSGDLSKVDLGGRPGSREAMDVGVTYTGKRFSGQVKATADKPLAAAPLTETGPTYGVDVGGSYSISKRVDLTAGVRYKSERDRLPQLRDDSHESQAVYIGTAFRF